jgi:hypothetical protein
VSVLTNTPLVSASEAARRLAEYRKRGFERRAPAQVVYQDPNVACPWPDCRFRIDGIHFRLDQWLDKAQQDRLLDAWWQGPGLVGRCPKCGRFVLYAVDKKTSVHNQSEFASAVLPDDWVSKTHIVSKSLAGESPP